MMSEKEIRKIENRVNKLNKICNGIKIEFIYKIQFYVIKVTDIKTEKSKLISLDELNNVYDIMTNFVKVK